MSETQAFLDESRAGAILAGTLIPTTIATFFVFGRLYSRLIILRNWGADDSWIFGSWVLAVASITVNCVLIDYGSGRHKAYLLLNPAIFIPRAKLTFVSRILYQVVIGTTKIGTCELYLRVFQDKKSIIMIRCLQGFISAFTFALLCTIFFGCSHIPDVWSATQTTCISTLPGLYTSTICNILADIMLIAFVIPRILPLNMPRRQKIALFGVAFLGILVIIAAIVNINLVLKQLDSADPMWDSFNVTTWSAVEVSTGLFCASAPAMKPFIRKFAPGLLYSLGGSRNGNNLYEQDNSGYGNHTGMHRSRHAGKHGSIELSSRNDVDFNTKTNTITNNIWRGDDDGIHMEDGGSEKAVLGAMKNKNMINRDIIKTVSVKVEEQGGRGIGARTSASRSEAGSIKGYEHI